MLQIAQSINVLTLKDHVACAQTTVAQKGQSWILLSFNLVLLQTCINFFQSCIFANMQFANNAILQEVLFSTTQTRSAKIMYIGDAYAPTVAQKPEEPSIL